MPGSGTFRPRPPQSSPNRNLAREGSQAHVPTMPGAMADAISQIAKGSFVFGCISTLHWTDRMTVFPRTPLPSPTHTVLHRYCRSCFSSATASASSRKAAPPAKYDLQVIDCRAPVSRLRQRAGEVEAYFPVGWRRRNRFLQHLQPLGQVPVFDQDLGERIGDRRVSGLQLVRLLRVAQALASLVLCSASAMLLRATASFGSRASTCR